MYVCVCNAVTERQIHQAVKDGAKTVKHLKDQLGVASECGACVGCAKDCIKAAKNMYNAEEPAFNQKVVSIDTARLNAA